MLKEGSITTPILNFMEDMEGILPLMPLEDLACLLRLIFMLVMARITIVILLTIPAESINILRREILH